MLIFIPFIIVVVLSFIFIRNAFNKYRQSIGIASKRPNNYNKKIIQEILNKYFYYFKQLNNKEKIIFINRVYNFFISKKWVGREELTITHEIKILISASAIQITFGIKHYLLNRFHSIYIYPDTYFNKITGKQHKGEVNAKGIIVLSWKYYIEGQKDLTDNINLGLHEMAHAIDISSLYSGNYFLNVIFEKFRYEAKDEFKSHKLGEIDFLRKYGRSNMKEFFAVLIETFFESPQLLKDKLPELYNDICILLNQNPLMKIYSGYNKTLYKPVTICSRAEKNIPIDVSLYSRLSRVFSRIIPAFFFITAFIIVPTILPLIKSGFQIESLIVISVLVSLLILFKYNLFYSKIYTSNNKVVVKKAFNKHYCFNINQIISISSGVDNVELEFVVYSGDDIKKIKVKNVFNPIKLVEFYRFMINNKVMVKYFRKERKNVGYKLRIMRKTKRHRI